MACPEGIVRMDAPAKGLADAPNWAEALGNSLGIALRTLWEHKLRSILTVLGIVIGIAAVVLIGATLGVVRDLAAESTARTIGADTFIIAQVASVGNLSRKELSDKLRKNPEIYRREAEVLAARFGKPGRTLRATTIARGYLAAGDKDRAFEGLEKGYEDRDPQMPYLGLPVYDDVRSDPRFQSLLRRIGLPQ